MSSSPNPVLTARGRLGYAASRNDPELLRAAHENLAEAKLQRAISDAIAAAPPLTDEARERLAMLLLRGAR